MSDNPKGENMRDYEIALTQIRAEIQARHDALAISSIETRKDLRAAHEDRATLLRLLEVSHSDRRERIATACLAALLSHDGWERMSVAYLVQHAAGYADELIAELGRGATP